MFLFIHLFIRRHWDNEKRNYYRPRGKRKFRNANFTTGLALGEKLWKTRSR